MFLFQKVEETTMKYTDARHAVGEFIIREQGNLHKYTIGDIAERTYTSKATVTRFAKAMGYDGWREFMKDYIEEVRHENAHKSEIDWNFPFTEDDSDESIIENLRKLQIESINETADLINKDVLNQAVSYLRAAKRIVIFGASPNIYFGELMRRNLLSIGKVASIAIPGESGITAASMTEEDCAILVSYSGNNPAKDPMDKISVLRRNRVNMIGITSGGDNYMRRHISCVFSMASRERLYTKIGNFSSEQSLQYIMNVLFSCLFARDYRKNKNYKIYNSRALEQARHTLIKDLKDNEK